MSTSQRRPISAEDLAALVLIDSPRLSPDGTIVTFTRTTTELAERCYRSAIWSVPYDGGEPRQLTSGTSRERSARWSPDGRWLAFIADRDGEKGQLYVLPTGGGEARAVTSKLAGIGGVAWSPDSARLAFTARVRPADQPSILNSPDTPVFREIRRIKHRSDGTGLLDGRAHLFVVERDGVAGSDGAAASQITDGDWDDSTPAWSPDGRSIAFASNRSPDRDWNDVSDIYVVPAAGGEARLLTDGGHALSAPAFSPDGQTVACLGRTLDAPAGANVDLWTVPAAGGAPRCLTAGLDISIGSDVLSDVRGGHLVLAPIWTPDSQHLRFLVSERGNVTLQEIGVDGGSLRQIAGGDRVLLDADGDGERIVFAASTPTNPGDLYTISADGSAERQITSLNDDLLASLALSEPEHLEFTGADGQAVEGWFLPGRGEGRRPLVLEIHGGPHSLYGNAFFHEFQLLAAEGYHVLYTNPRGSKGYGETFCSEIAGAWGDLDYRDLMAAVDLIVQRPDVDASRLGVAGGSYGGYMTNWIIGHTDRFKAAVTMRCLSNFVSFYGTSDIGPWFGERELEGSPRDRLMRYWDRSPLAHVEQVTTPVLILHGEQDLRCPIEQAEQWFVSLRRLGKTAEFVRFPDESHDMSRSGRPDRRQVRLQRIVGWFKEYLGS
ncbi:MAG: S9 family peptidase [Chloroflexi bacterium]|nr:S9 family peptidase [Chloroflexota bacterium]